MYNSELTAPLEHAQRTSIKPTVLRTAACTQTPYLRSVLKAVLSFVVVLTIGVTAWQLNTEFNLTGPLCTPAFLVAVGLAVAYRIANPVGWVLVLRGLGHQTDTAKATKIWLLAESRRWLPGGIWSYTSRAMAAQELGVSKTSASASLALELLVTIIAAVIVSIIGIAIYQQELFSTAVNLMPRNELHGYATMVTAVAVGGCLVAAMFIMAGKKLKRKCASLVQQITAMKELRLSSKWLGIAVGYMTLMAVFNGAVNMALLQTIDGASVPFVALVAATATAWVVGFFAFFSPGGILVREAALAALLLPWLPYETGFTIAALSRLAQLAAEVIGMLLALKK